MKCGGKSGRVVCAVVIVIVGGWVCPRPAAATITTIGDVAPVYDDSDPWSISDELIVGESGNGSVEVSAGSQIRTEAGYVGLYSGSTGQVTVTGEDSAWESSALYVGDEGTGAMTISDGATLVAPGVWLGNEAGSVGTLVITGAGTTWQGGVVYEIHVPFVDLMAQADSESYVSLGATIGNYGTGNITVSDGAQVSTDSGTLYLGRYEGGAWHSHRDRPELGLGPDRRRLRRL